MSGSSNFLQWNPSQANQESDAAYTADSQRSGGASVDGVFPSPTANKLFYQISTLCAAFAQAMANKGYTLSDANYLALVATLQNILTNADQRGKLQSVAYSPSINVDISKYTGFDIHLAGNCTITASGMTYGDLVTFVVYQDSTGGRTVTWPANFFGAVQPDPTPNRASVQSFRVNDGLNFSAETPSVTNLGISNTPVGVVAPAAGNFTALTAQTAAFSTSATAPTVAATDNSTNVATTAWNLLGFSASIGASGYVKFPTWLGGWMIQWKRGVTDLSGSSRGPFTENWPTAFPNNCFVVVPSVVIDTFLSGSNNEGYGIYLNGPISSLSTVNLYYDHRPDASADANFKAFLIGIGN